MMMTRDCVCNGKEQRVGCVSEDKAPISKVLGKMSVSGTPRVYCRSTTSQSVRLQYVHASQPYLLYKQL